MFGKCRLSSYESSEEAFNKPVLLRGWVTPPPGFTGQAAPDWIGDGSDRIGDIRQKSKCS